MVLQGPAAVKSVWTGLRACQGPGRTLLGRALLRRAEPRGRVLRAPARRGGAGLAPRHRGGGRGGRGRLRARAGARGHRSSTCCCATARRCSSAPCGRRTSRCSWRAGQPLSGESVRTRFLQPRPALNVHELAFFTEIDHVDHEAIGALDGVTREGVGVARYVREDERPHVAEAPSRSSTRGSGRGLGGKLLRRLSRRARPRTASAASPPRCSPTTSRCSALFERLGEVTVTRRDGPVIEILVEL